jgi:hypothetical protein
MPSNKRMDLNTRPRYMARKPVRPWPLAVRLLFWISFGFVLGATTMFFSMGGRLF